MGQFQDLLDKINQVEAQGFDPYTESYSARIGKLEQMQAITPDDPPNSGSPTQVEAAVVTASDPNQKNNISESFTKLGYDDPFQDLVTKTGEFDLSKLSSGFNYLQEDPGIGVSEDDYINFINTEYKDARIKTYGDDTPIVKTKTGGLGFEKPKEDKSYTFQIGSTSGTYPRKDVYLRYDDETGEHISYDTKKAYEAAIEKYNKTTGNNLKVTK